MKTKRKKNLLKVAINDIAAIIDKYQKTAEKLQEKGDYSYESTSLWNILSLVRGPDNKDEGVKSQTVYPIRKILNIRTYGKLLTPTMTSQQITDACGAHFLSHAMSAQRALEKAGYKTKLIKEQ